MSRMKMGGLHLIHRELHRDRQLVFDTLHNHGSEFSQECGVLGHIKKKEEEVEK